uniref:Uncharacterized protein n=1 Tax=Aegilops tauschii TaxID=37682 RepID=M8B5J1_AEGTA
MEFNLPPGSPPTSTASPKAVTSPVALPHPQAPAILSPTPPPGSTPTSTASQAATSPVEPPHADVSPFFEPIPESYAQALQQSEDSNTTMTYLKHLRRCCGEDARRLWASGSCHLKMSFDRLKVHLESALRTFLLESFKSQSPETIKKRFASEDKMKQFIQVQTKLTVMQMPSSRAMSNKDLTQIADTIVPNFMINGVIPVFMEHFTNALKSHGTLAEEDFQSWYYAYLLLHPFVMSSIGRANLLRNLYWLLVDLNFEENPFFDTVFKVAPSSNWRDFIKQTPMNYILWKVFWYKLIPNFNTLPYFNLLGSIIKYHCHLVHHGPDHARDGKLTTMSSTDDNELLAAAHDQDCLAECIKNLLQQKKVTSE